MKLKWNVYRINNSKDKVETFNVFDHFSFNNETIRLLKTCSTITEFSQNLKRQVIYYFAWKFEYEICITSLFSHKEETEEKIDIRHQLELNWDAFVEYIWNHKEKVLNV